MILGVDDETISTADWVSRAEKATTLERLEARRQKAIAKIAERQAVVDCLDEQIAFLKDHTYSDYLKKLRADKAAKALSINGDKARRLLAEALAREREAADAERYLKHLTARYEAIRERQGSPWRDKPVHLPGSIAWVRCASVCEIRNRGGEWSRDAIRTLRQRAKTTPAHLVLGRMHKTEDRMRRARRSAEIAFAGLKRTGVKRSDLDREAGRA